MLDVAVEDNTVAWPSRATVPATLPVLEHQDLPGVHSDDQLCILNRKFTLPVPTGPPIKPKRCTDGELDDRDQAGDLHKIPCLCGLEYWLLLAGDS